MVFVLSFQLTSAGEADMPDGSGFLQAIEGGEAAGLLERVLNLSFCAVVVFRPVARLDFYWDDFEILQANPAALSLVGRARAGDVVGKTLRQLSEGLGASALINELSAVCAFGIEREFDIDGLAGFSARRLRLRAAPMGGDCFACVSVAEDAPTLLGELRQLRGTVEMLCRVAEVRDPYTGQHLRRVADIAGEIAGKLGMAAERQEIVRCGALLHDIGKIGMPSELLAKSGRMTAPEMALIRSHAEIGHEILDGIALPPELPLIALQHHERLDGTGYPHGLREEAILPEAQIVAVADVIEAMSSHRPYRPSLGLGPALDAVRQGRGRLFDEEIADAALALFAEAEQRRREARTLHALEPLAEAAD